MGRRFPQTVPEIFRSAKLDMLGGNEQCAAVAWRGCAASGTAIALATLPPSGNEALEEFYPGRHDHEKSLVPGGGVCVATWVIARHSTEFSTKERKIIWYNDWARIPIRPPN
jgi:hypothetical protein